MNRLAIAGFVALGIGVVVACDGSLSPSEPSPADGGAPANDAAGGAEGGDPTPDEGGKSDGSLGLEDAAGNADAGDAGAGDAADAAPVCDPVQSFAPAFAPSIEVPGLEFPPGGPPFTGVRLTADELRAVYMRPYIVGNSPILVESTRASRSDPFSGSRTMGELVEAQAPGGGVLPIDYGTFSPDGLVIYFADGAHTIFRAERASASLPFDARTPVAALPSGDNGTPYLVGNDLWFSRFGGTDFDIFHVSLPDGAASVPVPEAELDEANVQDVNPVVSADGLTVFFARATVLPGQRFISHPRIMEARRTTLGSPFTIHETCELNTTGDERPTWLSPDGCRLYFTSNFRVRVASRCGP